MIFQVLVSDSSRLNAEIVSLTYEGGNFTMLLILPHLESNLTQTTYQLGQEDFSEMHNNCSLESTLLSVPKFNVSTKTKLQGVLENLGVKDIFNELSANLSGIAEGDTFVSDAIHEAKLVVNEEGSEAAGVTVFTLDTRGFISKPKRRIIFNRPFFMVIHDLDTNIPLFVGKIVNPTGAEVQGELNELGNRIVNRPLDLIVNEESEDIEHSDAEEQANLIRNPKKTTTTEVPCVRKDGRPHLPVEDSSKIFFPCVSDEKEGPQDVLGTNGESEILVLKAQPGG